jgi:hypothetical protein
MVQRRRFLKAAAAGVASGLCLCGKVRSEEAAKAEADAPSEMGALLKKNFGGRG